MPTPLSSTNSAPVLFIGHGSPHYVLGGNPFFASWQATGEWLRQHFPTIDTIICCSAHWHSRHAGHWQVMADRLPPTVHDFSGFPPAMYDIQYPAAGSPDMAADIAAFLNRHAQPASLSEEEWGLDHGMWTVFQALYPSADKTIVPISVQLDESPSETAALQKHYALGQAIRAWRTESNLDEKVLILGSGNVVHNFGLMRVPTSHAMWQQALEFDASIGTAIANRNHEPLWAESLRTLRRNAHPTNEHYTPLLFAAGASAPDDTVHQLTTGSYPAHQIPGGMRSVIWHKSNVPAPTKALAY